MAAAQRISPKWDREDARRFTSATLKQRWREGTPMEFRIWMLRPEGVLRFCIWTNTFTSERLEGKWPPQKIEMIRATVKSKSSVSPCFCAASFFKVRENCLFLLLRFCHYSQLFCEWSIKPAIMSHWHFILSVHGLCLLQHNEFLWLRFGHVNLYNPGQASELQFSVPAS